MIITFKSQLDLLHSVYKIRYGLTDEEAEKELNYIYEKSFLSKIKELSFECDRILVRDFPFKMSEK